LQVVLVAVAVVVVVVLVLVDLAVVVVQLIMELLEHQELNHLNHNQQELRIMEILAATLPAKLVIIPVPEVVVLVVQEQLYRVLIQLVVLVV
jgi:hypothetical protein